MEKKEIGIYTGLGVLLGVGIGLMAFKNLKVTSIGNLYLTVSNEGDEK